jgi:hypothetical protein
MIETAHPHLQDTDTDEMDRVRQIQQAIEQKIDFMSVTMEHLLLQQQDIAADSQVDRQAIGDVALLLKEKIDLMCVRQTHGAVHCCWKRERVV